LKLLHVEDAVASKALHVQRRELIGRQTTLVHAVIHVMSFMSFHTNQTYQKMASVKKKKSSEHPGVMIKQKQNNHLKSDF